MNNLHSLIDAIINDLKQRGASYTYFIVGTSNLNKVLAYRGTPLQLCTMHNNVEAFQLLAEQGADVGKRALGQTPLEECY